MDRNAPLRATQVGGRRRLAHACSKALVLLPASLGFAAATSTAVAAITFSDRSGSAHVNFSSESYGASFGDLNGDGYLDIYASNHRMQDALYLNMGDGSFYRISSQVLPWRNHKGADTHGGSFADIDNDGDQDLLITTGANNPTILLYNENQRLVDRAKERGVAALSVGGRLPVWLDYDGDKLLDFVMTQFGGGARLYHQETDGTFADVTSLAKLVCTKFHYGELYDANNDGQLDFLCPDQDVYPQRIYKTTTWPWTKIFEASNPYATWFPRVSGVVDSVIADFDNDGREDIFLLGNTQLHPSAVVPGQLNPLRVAACERHQGLQVRQQRTHHDQAGLEQADENLQVPDLTKIQIGANSAHPSTINFTLDPADSYVVGMPPPPTSAAELPVMQVGYDPATQQWTLAIWAKLASGGSGVFSVAYMQVDSTSAITGLKATGLWPGDLPARPTLLMNRPASYVEETVRAGLDAPVSCVSATAGDFDNDMDVDLYLACRTGASNIANILYENLGNGTFQKASSFGAAGPVGLAIASGAGTADSVISGDYDVDGRLDLFVTNGLNLQPRGFGGPIKLFHNDSAARHWIEIDLVGKQSDRDATGAKVYATAGGVEQLRVQNGAYHRWSQDAKRAHFGLAGYGTVDLRVEWPSGNVQTFNDVSANRLYRVTENGGIAPVPLGVAPAYPCGAPALNGGKDKGAFVWRDCPTGQWSMRVMSANTAITYQGTITSTSNFATVRPRALETNDVLDTSNPKQIAFTLRSTGTGSDGADFKLPDGADACFRLPVPSGAQLFMGPFKTPISKPINLETQAGC